MKDIHLFTLTHISLWVSSNSSLEGPLSPPVFVFLLMNENMQTNLKKDIKKSHISSVLLVFMCGIIEWLCLFSSFQECSSFTPAWLCWASSSSTAACRRPKPGVWRRLKHCLKTNFVPVAPRIQTRDGRLNTSESKVQTTIYQTTMHLMWIRESVLFDNLSGRLLRFCDNWNMPSAWVCSYFIVSIWDEELMFALFHQSKIL